MRTQRNSFLCRTTRKKYADCATLCGVYDINRKHSILKLHLNLIQQRKRLAVTKGDNNNGKVVSQKSSQKLN